MFEHQPTYNSPAGYHCKLRHTGAQLRAERLRNLEETRVLQDHRPALGSGAWLCCQAVQHSRTLHEVWEMSGAFMLCRPLGVVRVWKSSWAFCGGCGVQVV